MNSSNFINNSLNNTEKLSNSLEENKVSLMKRPLSFKNRRNRLKLSITKPVKCKSAVMLNKYTLSNHYEIIKTLGSGTYASVHLAIDKLTNEKVAIKISRRQNSREKLLNENNILLSLQHENIIKPIKFIENEMKNESYLVMEYFEGKDLSDYINNNGTLTLEDSKKVISQISDWISYLHSQGIAHRDIKPENLLIDEELKIKLIDFNISKKMKAGKDKSESKFSSIFYTQISSPLYAAPEIKENLLYSESVDIWGVGILMFTCLYGCIWNFKNSVNSSRFLRDKIESNTIVSLEVQDFLLTLLEEEPHLRPSADELLASDILN